MGARLSLTLFVYRRIVAIWANVIKILIGGLAAEPVQLAPYAQAVGGNSQRKSKLDPGARGASGKWVAV